MPTILPVVAGSDRPPGPSVRPFRRRRGWPQAADRVAGQRPGKANVSGARARADLDPLHGRIIHGHADLGGLARTSSAYSLYANRAARPRADAVAARLARSVSRGAAQAAATRPPKCTADVDRRAPIASADKGSDAKLKPYPPEWRYDADAAPLGPEALHRQPPLSVNTVSWAPLQASDVSTNFASPAELSEPVVNRRSTPTRAVISIAFGGSRESSPRPGLQPFHVRGELDVRPTPRTASSGSKLQPSGRPSTTPFHRRCNVAPAGADVDRLDGQKRPGQSPASHRLTTENDATPDRSTLAPARASSLALNHALTTHQRTIAAGEFRASPAPGRRSPSIHRPRTWRARGTGRTPSERNADAPTATIVALSIGPRHAVSEPRAGEIGR